MSKLLEIANTIIDEEAKKSSLEIVDMTGKIKTTDSVPDNIIEIASVEPEEL